MNTTIPTTNALHVHYWVHMGQETDLDDASVVYLYRCSTCGKVKRQ